MTENHSQGHVLGNFHNYYTFHSAESRISFLTPEIIEETWKINKSPLNFYILDVGCNDGDLSIELHHAFLNVLQPFGVSVKLIGVDVDEELIYKASLKVADTIKDSVRFIACNIMDSETVKELHVAMTSWNIIKFHLISAFSITMWIHLNHNDEGLSRFLHLLSSIGSSILIEPQTWKSYKNAVKRTKKLTLPKPKYYDEIKYRGSVDKDIEHIMIHECGYPLSEIRNIGTDTWGRPIQIYHHCHDDDINSSAKRIKTS